MIHIGGEPFDHYFQGDLGWAVAKLLSWFGEDSAWR